MLAMQVIVTDRPFVKDTAWTTGISLNAKDRGIIRIVIWHSPLLIRLIYGKTAKNLLLH